MFAEPRPAERSAPARAGWFWLGLALLAAALVWGVTALFDLRFSSGDLFPYASSRRADPLGSKALHDALAELPGVRVDRNVRPLDRLELDGPTTVLLLGAEPGELAADDAELLVAAEGLASRGARVVIAFRSIERAPLGADESSSEERDRAAVGAQKTVKPKLWGFSARWAAHDGNTAGPVAHAERAADASPDLPQSLAVRSVLSFADPAAAWTAVYRAGKDAVWLERRVGLGSLAVAADGYPFSNEALLLERQSALLAWAIGSSPTIVFDESHLGVEEASGVMVLARRYRLQGVIGVLCVLALLFVWRSASTLAEPPAAAARHLVEGGDAAEGLARLLGRGIPAREVLGVAANRWARDCGRGNPPAAAAARAVAAASSDPAAGYAAVRAALAALAPRLVSPGAARSGDSTPAPPTPSPSVPRKEDHAG